MKYNSKKSYNCIIKEVNKDETDVNYIIESKEIPGIIGGGDSLDEAFSMYKEVLNMYKEVTIKNGTEKNIL